MQSYMTEYKRDINILKFYILVEPRPDLHMG